jgi:hypothetical protein
MMGSKVKQVLSKGGYCERRESKQRGWQRANMLYVCMWKLNSEACWNYSKWGGVMREHDGVVNLIKMQYKHTCKGHKDTLLYNLYMLIKI